jgi:quinol monooxygenase YgiN
MTVNVMINYTVKADQADANEAAVKDFIAEAAAANDPEFEYSSFRLDETSFMHVGRFADDDAVKRFQSLSGFKAFGDGLRERSVEGPNASRPTLVASTRG